MSKKIILGIVLIALFAFTGCVTRPKIKSDLEIRMDAIEARLAEIETTLDELKYLSDEAYKAHENDKILNENLEMLYDEVDELRAKMGMPLSKPRRILVK